MRRQTRKVWVGRVPIGGNAPVVVQSMTNTKTTAVAETLRQIEALETAGCQIIRLAIPNVDAVSGFREIRKKTDMPLVADIHFDYRLALMAIEEGADKIRINPGNIGKHDRVKEIVRKAVAYEVPIRVGVNAGSLEKDILQKEGGPTAEALVESALRNLDLCRQFGAEDLVLSLKSSDVLITIAAYRKVAKMTDIPLHLGVTEAGTLRAGTVKSAVAMGILLAEGIGDTIRVSLTSDPVDEVVVAYEILKSLHLRRHGVDLISCPTCGRIEVDLIAITQQVEARLAAIDKPLKVAVMGCEVNGPGEARDADIGVACGKKSAILFKKGKIVRKIPEDQIVDVLIQEIENWS